MGRWLWWSVLIVVLDQVTKVIAEQWLLPLQPLPVLPSFNLTLMYNTGAAFSFLAGAGGWQRGLFIVLASVISVVLVIWLLRLSRDQRLQAAALVLVLGGAVGNLIDRILYGHVIDFIQLYYQQWYWPTFNIADAAISVGAVLLIIDTLFYSGRETASDRQ
jgi:signal peptidase II